MRHPEGSLKKTPGFIRHTKRKGLSARYGENHQPAKPGRHLYCLVLLLVFSSGIVSAQTPGLDQLASSGRLQVKSWIEPDESIVVKQHVTLVIEVSTDTWFSGGTRIGRLEIDDAIILRREKFAVNSTRVEQGTTYTTQRWSISIYPQRAGRYEVPPLPLTLSIAGENGEAIEGEINTMASSFVVELPEALQTVDNWVSTTEFRVEESYNRDLADLKPGDALQRLVTFAGEDIASMMLPEIKATKQEGLGVYQKPPQLKDDNNRGIYRARRTEAITYVIERPGRYRIPEQVYYWWDLDSQSLQVVTLPEQILDATGGMEVEASDPAAGAEVEPEHRIGLAVAAALAGLLLAALIAYLWQRRKPVPVDAPEKRTPAVASEQHLQQQLQAALRRRDWPGVVQSLYAWLDHYGGSDYDGSIRPLLQRLQKPEAQQALDQLMQGAFYSGSCEEGDIEAFVRMLESELASHSSWWRPTPVELKLN